MVRKPVHLHKAVLSGYLFEGVWFSRVKTVLRLKFSVKRKVEILSRVRLGRPTSDAFLGQHFETRAVEISTRNHSTIYGVWPITVAY